MKTRSAFALFPLILAAIIAAGTYWLQVATQPDETPNDGRLRHDPDYFIENFTARKYAVSGELENTLVAQRLVHYPNDDTSEIFLPQIFWHLDPVGRISADKAWMTAKAKHIELIGNVYAWHQGKDGQLPTELTTTRMSVYPDDKIVRTDEPVIITQGLSVVQGKGLDADGKKQLYALRSRARGIIYPQTNNSAQPHENPAPSTKSGNKSRILTP